LFSVDASAVGGNPWLRHSLPATSQATKLYRCKRHLLLDGNPRCLAVVEVELQGRTFYILEVDTSDGVCSLSTLLLRLKSSLDWPKQLTLLAEELTQKSLHWPSQRLKMLCGKDGYSGIPPADQIRG
jgi:hypothetical protein